MSDQSHPVAIGNDTRNKKPEQRLAEAVLAAAIEDLTLLNSEDPAARRGAEQAARFLQGGGNFALWCGLVGMDHEAAAERGKELVAKMTKGGGRQVKSNRDPVTG